ncbi:MAG TPA: hypothetical protein VG652_11895 [Gaiellaceae bacterium]|nr:hypothetical protein [Gaiellaceae bacterium]
MAKGPLVVRWGDWTLSEPQAGAISHVQATLENAGTVSWGPGIKFACHWLDDLGNPIIWDSDRTALPPLAPGESATVQASFRAPIPPGRYRFALDLVAERRAWFSELGSEMVTADVDVAPRSAKHHVSLPDWVEPTGDWDERVGVAHAEGFSVVAGAIQWNGGLFNRRPHALAPYEPGPGRVPSFPYALLCPSVIDGTELERLPDIEGLPAFAAPPPFTEPWIYDGRIVLSANPHQRT